MRGGRILLAAALVIGAASVAVPAPAAGPVLRDGIVQSFDGTPIAYTLMLPAGASASRPVPLVFNTHGWGGERNRDASGMSGTLLKNGYAVLTWDARGFGDSGGEAQVDSQQYEVRDVEALIDFAAKQHAIQLDRRGDPRMGMVGGSYAGGIQLMTAAADRRVDAIVPAIAWNDLVRSLKPGGVLKFGWGTLLYGDGVANGLAGGLDSPAGPQTGALAPQIHEAYAQSVALNDWTSDIRAWFAARSTGRYINGAKVPGVGRIAGIRAPTLILQGINDTLFNLNEAIDNFRQIRANGVPVKLIAFCGGLTEGATAHAVNAAGTSCTSDERAEQKLTGATLAWLDRYVRVPLGDARTGAPIEYQLQDGSFRSARSFSAPVLRATFRGSLVHKVVPTSGVVTAAQPSPDGLRSIIDAPAGATIVGAPKLDLTISGAGTEAYLFFKLLDQAPDGSLTVVDDQVTPHKFVGLSSKPTRVSIGLGGVAWRIERGHRLLLEVSTSSNDYTNSRFPSVADLAGTLRVPALGLASAQSFQRAPRRPTGE
jgi:ABC-2 type transport system ATP-binding protein